ncbi:DNA-binding protein [Staphylococcus roterodami]|nr:DNA-binding protein [Staphylococcus roterodami]
MNLPKIGNPATRALYEQGIHTLETASQHTKSFLSSLHGVGPKAISILERALSEHNLHFKQEGNHVLPFSLTGDVSCDHAPKRQQMIDFIIATATLDIKLLRSLVTTQFIWSVPDHFDIHGPQILIQELSEHQGNIESIDIQSIITHGHLGALHGTQTFKNGEQTHFANFFEFENHKRDAKVSKVTSYIVID